MKKVIEGLGVGVKGYEEDYIHIFGKNIVGAADLMPEYVNWRVFTALTTNDTEYREWSKIRDEYRKESGRKYPPIYRIKITVEVEELSDNTAEVVWKSELKRQSE